MKLLITQAKPIKKSCRPSYQYSLVIAFFAVTMGVQAAPLTTAAEPIINTETKTAAETVDDSQSTSETALSNTPIDNYSHTFAAQLQPSNTALLKSNQKLLTHNTKLQRQVNDLQTQVDVLVYESKGQLFIYGALTVLISLMIGIFISWLFFRRRERW